MSELMARHNMLVEMYRELKEKYDKLIMEFLVDLKEIRGLFNIIKNHKSYNGIIEKWEKRHE